MALIKFDGTYQDITSLENLLGAWKEFIKGKKARKDVQEFERNLMSHLIQLHRDLVAKTYVHSQYEAFPISDPKPRSIHKAGVRDRLLHHAIYRKLYPYFDKRFIHDSYSCRLQKGTHKAIQKFRQYTNKVGKNNTKPVWVLKCDVKKFFASIDQIIMISILSKHIEDREVLQLLVSIITSFSSTESGKGLPLGNLTSQLLVNIYMNEFDQFMKHGLKVGHYIRYADDFVIIHQDKRYLETLLGQIKTHLTSTLQLSLHPDKVSIKAFASGVDFLGWVHFPDHRVFRTVTKRRMFTKLIDNPAEQAVESYLGLLKHGNTNHLKENVTDIVKGVEIRD